MTTKGEVRAAGRGLASASVRAEPFAFYILAGCEAVTSSAGADQSPKRCATATVPSSTLPATVCSPPRLSSNCHRPGQPVAP